MNVKDAINARRAYRSLEPFEISDEVVDELVEAIRLAPSCFNRQPWRYVFVRDPDVLKMFHEALPPGNAWVKAAGMIVAVFSRKDLGCVLEGRDYNLYDTGTATGFMILRATELGLVAHPIAGYDENRVKEVLGIPKDWQVITLVNVGKKSDRISPVLSDKQVEAEKQRPERLKREEFIFMDRYEAGK